MLKGAKNRLFKRSFLFQENKNTIIFLKGIIRQLRKKTIVMQCPLIVDKNFDRFVSRNKKDIEVTIKFIYTDLKEVQK